MATKLHVATKILSQPQSASKTLPEDIQEFTDLVFHATGTDPTAGTCQETSVLFIRQLSNKKIQKQVAEAKQSRCLGMH